MSHHRSRSRSRSPNRRYSRRRSESRPRNSSPRRDTYGRDRQHRNNASNPSRSRYEGGDSNDFYAHRIAERKSIKYSIWNSFPSPPSPKPERKEKKTQKHRSPSPSSSSEEEKRPKRKKSKRKSKSKSKKRSRQRTPSPSSSSSSSDSSEDEKEVHQSTSERELAEIARFREEVQGVKGKVINDEEEVIGPMPMPDPSTTTKSVPYGKDLLPGEGAAIAQYVQKNLRIPRRGEVGWSGNEIEQLETAGYVMSGSRHQHMNAIRIRKENQVYSAEEKRALALINIEEKQQREQNLMADFRDLLTERLTKKHGADVVEDRQNQPLDREL